MDTIFCKKLEQWGLHPAELRRSLVEPYRGRERRGAVESTFSKNAEIGLWSLVLSILSTEWPYRFLMWAFPYATDGVYDAFIGLRYLGMSAAAILALWALWEKMRTARAPKIQSTIPSQSSTVRMDREDD